MKRKKQFSLKEEYKLCWGYIKESDKFIYAAFFIFLFSALIGFFVPVPELITEKIIALLQELVKQTQNLSFPGLISFIFFNNLQSTFFAIFLGIFLGIYPFISALTNGFLLGFVSFMTLQETGVFDLWRLLPHGIFELPAVFISIGLGLKMWTFIFEKNKAEAFKRYLFNSMRVFFYVIVPLLFTAAIIESILISLS
jgi:stage II sporulation protein M